MKAACILAELVLVWTLVSQYSAPVANGYEAHISGTANTKIVGSYRIQFKAIPTVPSTHEVVSFLFSIQDLEGNNLENLRVRVMILEGDRPVHEFIEKTYPSGDFALNYSFEREGNFKIILVISATGGNVLAEFPISVFSGGLLFLLSYGPLIGIAIILGLVGLLHIKGVRKK